MFSFDARDLNICLSVSNFHNIKTKSHPNLKEQPDQKKKAEKRDSLGQLFGLVCTLAIRLRCGLWSC